MTIETSRLVPIVPLAHILNVNEALDRLNYPGLVFQTKTEGSRMFLRVHNPDGVCNHSSEPLPWNGRWWALSEHMTTSEIVGTAFKAVLTALEHEARESFLYKGQPVYDAHLDVEELARVRADKANLDVRG